MSPVTRFSSRLLTKYLTKTISTYRPFSVHRATALAAILEPGDVLLVEGDQRVSSAIKYLTQSTWSHAAFYIGRAPVNNCPHRTEVAAGSALTLIEADLERGVIMVPPEKYARYNIRICRPINLSDSDREALCQYMADSLGKKYDLQNIVDLLRYLLPNPPVPRRWRRSLLALGSSDPTRAICSSLIAQAFQSIGYPILPDKLSCSLDGSTDQEIMHIRHHSLYTPRDFDISPYFQIIKPELHNGFDYQKINWKQHTPEFLVTGDHEAGQPSNQ